MFDIGDQVKLEDSVYDYWKVPRGTVMAVQECNPESLGYRVCPADLENAVGRTSYFWVDADKLHPVVFKKAKAKAPRILDSGERTEYDTGAVRDCKEGKGRCDLMPLDVVARLLKSDTLDYIGVFQVTGGVENLLTAICYFSANEWRPQAVMGSTGGQFVFKAMLEVSKHFEEGAKKYGPNNWQKGIPVHSYIDSAVRHYLKFRAGWTDEPHDRAFVWNLLCCIWTMEHHPELDDFTEKGKKDNAD